MSKRTSTGYFVPSNSRDVLGHFIGTFDHEPKIDEGHKPEFTYEEWDYRLYRNYRPRIRRGDQWRYRDNLPLQNLLATRLAQIRSRKHKASSIAILLSSLERLGFDLDASRAVFRDFREALHCVRCHMDYDPREATATSCHVRHNYQNECDMLSIEGPTHFEHPCCNLKYGGLRPDIFSSIFTNPGPCYRGSHTTVFHDVMFPYNDDAKHRCKKDGCRRRLIVATTPKAPLADYVKRFTPFRVPTSGDILTHYFGNQGSDLFHISLSAMLRQEIHLVDVGALDLLLRSLECIGVDFTPSRQWALDMKPLSCARCLEDYDPRQNGPSSCAQRHHRQPESQTYHKFSHYGTHEWRYPCCARVMYGSEGGPHGDYKYPDFCFVSWHTTDKERVPRTLQDAVAAGPNPYDLRAYRPGHCEEPIDAVPMDVDIDMTGEVEEEDGPGRYFKRLRIQ